MEGDLAFEQIRVPIVPECAGRFVAEFEAATPDSPVSLNVLARDGDLAQELQGWLKATNDLYKRHRELFFNDGAKWQDVRYRDLRGILKLSRDTNGEARRQLGLNRSMSLGFAALQFSEAGSRLAHDPLLVQFDDEATIDEEILRAGLGLVNSSLNGGLADRIRGDNNKLPNARVGYIGSLLDTLYAFCVSKAWDEPKLRAAVSADILRARQGVLRQFPGKVKVYDHHSLMGRPWPSMLREELELSIKELHETLQNDTPTGQDMVDSVRDATRLVFYALDAAIRVGCSQEACLRLVAQHSMTLGRVSERTKTGLSAIVPDDICFERRNDTLQLIIRAPQIKRPKHLSKDEIKKLQTLDEKGGLCPVRHFLPLTPNGETHQKVCQFACAVQERVGVLPPVLRETPRGVYLDLGALTVNYVLLIVADNYRIF